MTQPTSNRTFLDFAMDAAWQAGQLTLAHFQTGVVVEQKADESAVTVADRDAERLLRRLIQDRFPGHAIIGVAHFPGLGEMIGAAKDEGCRWNGRPARVSDVSRLDQALVAYTDCASFDAYGRAAAWAHVQESSHTQRGWGDCYGHCLVATGRAEVMLDPIMSVWDCAALLPILQQAGGTFTDWNGEATVYNNEAVSTNGALFDQLMEIVKGER